MTNAFATLGLCAMIALAAISIDTREQTRTLRARAEVSAGAHQEVVDAMSDRIRRAKNDLSIAMSRTSKRLDLVASVYLGPEKECTQLCSFAREDQSCLGPCEELCDYRTSAECMRRCDEVACVRSETTRDFDGCTTCKNLCTRTTECDRTWCDPEYPPRRECVQAVRDRRRACKVCLAGLPGTDRPNSP